MKRIVALVLSGMLLASVGLLAGCSGNQTYEPESKDPQVSTPTIGEDGVLRVGVDTTNAPLAGMLDNKIVGIDVDVAAAIADELGLKLTLVDVGADPETALNDGSVDIVMGIDQSSNDNFWKSDTYLQTGVVLLATDESKGVPEAKSGSTFVAQVSSKSAWAVMNEFGEQSLTSTTDLTEAVDTLLNGSVDYMASDAIKALYAVDQAGAKANIVALLQPAGGYCVGVLADNAELQNTVTATIQTLTSNGVISLIEQKWLDGHVDLEGVALTAGATTDTDKADTADDKADTKDEAAV